MAAALAARLHWGWEPLELGAACRDQGTACGPLATLALVLFQDRGLFDSCRVAVATAVGYFTAVETHYLNLPYHNAGHACDVLHSVHHILTASGAAAQLPPHEVMAALVAAATHDVGHTGRSNSFHVATRSPLALRYNDTQVMESHHAATAFELMAQPGCDLAGGLGGEQAQVFRDLVTCIILSTDIGVHGSFMAEARQVLGAQPAGSLTSGDPAVRWVALRLAVKCADVSNGAKDAHSALRWGMAIMSEFFTQGDEERSLGLPPTPGFDRRTVNVRSSQLAFQDKLAIPMFEMLAAVAPSVGGPMLERAHGTRAFFAAQPQDGDTLGGHEHAPVEAVGPQR